MKTYTPYFIFKGVDSRKMGVIVTKMPPTVRASERVDSVTIPGRSGSLHEKDGAFDNYTRTMECAIKNKKYMDEICAWLVGEGDLILSSESDKVYRVNIVNTISISQMMNTFQKFMVTMDTFPFKKSVNAFDDNITIDAETVLFNRGTVYSLPILKIHGSGDVGLTINGVDYNINNVVDHVTINSEIEECYKDNVNKNNDYLADSFPQFVVGDNTITLSGDIERVEIIPNWRWL